MDISVRPAEQQNSTKTTEHLPEGECSVCV